MGEEFSKNYNGRGTKKQLLRQTPPPLNFSLQMQEFNLFKVLGNYGASAIFGRKNTLRFNVLRNLNLGLPTPQTYRFYKSMCKVDKS